jgi:hypothetical protein
MDKLKGEIQSGQFSIYAQWLGIVDSICNFFRRCPIERHLSVIFDDGGRKYF